MNARSPDADRTTALHCAAAGGSAQATEAIRTLLRFGANRDARDAAGLRAADLLPVRDPAAERLLGAVPTPQAHVGCGGLHLGGPAASSAPATGVVSDLDEVYASDAFKIFEFKVRRCTKTRAHDWTECPFTHPGEKARRRDPRRFAYCGTACPDFRKGSCRRGDACEFAHGVFECWLHPARYRTQSCKDGAACARRVCFFAHAPGELRAPTDPFGRAGSPPERGAGSASPTGHPLPHSHSPSQAASASPPRSASPPQPADTFADLAAYGMLPPTVTRGAGQQLHGRRVCSIDGGSRPMHTAAYFAAPSYYGSPPDPSVSMAAAAAAVAAEHHLAHLNLAAAAAGQSTAIRFGQTAAAAAAALAQQHAAAASRRASTTALPLSASAPASGGMFPPVPSLLAAAQLAAAARVAQQRANIALAQSHMAAAAAAATLAGKDLAAAAAETHHPGRRPPARAAPAATPFPRPSSFAHLGIIEGVLDDELPAYSTSASFAGSCSNTWGAQEQQTVGWA